MVAGAGRGSGLLGGLPALGAFVLPDWSLQVGEALVVSEDTSAKTPAKARSRWLGSSFTVRPVPRFDAKASIVCNKSREQPGWRNGAKVRKV